MRLEYTSNPPSFASSADKDILARVVKRRGRGGLLAIDQTLLHAPQICDGFNAYFKAVRTQNSLPADIRELCFCTVAAITRCWYEWDIHAPIAVEAGVTEEALKLLREEGQQWNTPEARAKPDQEGFTGFSDKQAAVIRLAKVMTTDVQVGDDVFEPVKKAFDPKEVVEIVASIAGFNLVTRFVVALNVGERNG